MTRKYRDNFMRAREINNLLRDVSVFVIANGEKWKPRFMKGLLYTVAAFVPPDSSAGCETEILCFGVEESVIGLTGT